MPLSPHCPLGPPGGSAMCRLLGSSLAMSGWNPTFQGLAHTAGGQGTWADSH